MILRTKRLTNVLIIDCEIVLSKEFKIVKHMYVYVYGVYAYTMAVMGLSIRDSCTNNNGDCNLIQYMYVYVFDLKT